MILIPGELWASVCLVWRAGAPAGGAFDPHPGRSGRLAILRLVWRRAVGTGLAGQGEGGMSALNAPGRCVTARQEVK